VHSEQRNFAGTVVAWLRHERVVDAAGRATSSSDAERAFHLGREVFVNSQQRASALALARVGLDPSRVSFQVAWHDITGPSGGLVYALAILDMVDPSDLAAGRVVIATGELSPDGTVKRVGYVDVKAATAQRVRADVFIVPAGQEEDARGVVAARGVSSLDEAVRLLAEVR